MSTSDAWMAGYRAGARSRDELPAAYAERFAEQDDRIGRLQQAMEQAIDEIDAGKPHDARSVLADALKVAQ